MKTKEEAIDWVQKRPPTVEKIINKYRLLTIFDDDDFHSEALTAAVDTLINLQRLDQKKEIPFPRFEKGFRLYFTRRCLLIAKMYPSGGGDGDGGEPHPIPQTDEVEFKAAA